MVSFWWIIIIIIMNAISFILNGLVLFVLVRNKDLAKRKRITYHVANIAIADTLYGLGSFCFYTIELHPYEVRTEKLLPLIIMYSFGYLASLAAVLLMTIERSIVISKPLTWNKILPRKRMLLLMLCSWIAVAVTLLGVIYYFRGRIEYTGGQGVNSTLGQVNSTLHTVFLFSTAAVNIYIFKNLKKNDGFVDSQQSTRSLPQATTQQKPIYLKQKASKLMLLLAGIMIVTCLPNSLLSTINNTYAHKLHCNLGMNLTIIYVISILENLNFLVNPLVYIWKDRMYRNAFYRTFKIKTQF